MDITLHLTVLNVLLWVYVVGGIIFGLTWTRAVVVDMFKGQFTYGGSPFGFLCQLFLFGLLALALWPLALLVMFLMMW